MSAEATGEAMDAIAVEEAPVAGSVPALSPIDVLIVASWFPAYDDPAAGRFVADQAEALAATGVARVAVVTFDTARLSGGATSRGRQAAVVLNAARAAASVAEPLFLAPAWSVDPALPVARLSIPDGLTAAAGPAHTSAHRRGVLRALGARLVGEGASDRRGVVHAHTVYPDGVAAVALADALGWPLLLTEHSSFVEKIVAAPAIREAYAAALTRADRTLAVSEMLADELRAAFPEQAARIEVLPNAVPLDLFPAAQLDDRVADELLFVGYRKATKGIENLLRAVAVARARRPTVTLRLLGRSPDDATESRWLGLVTELGLEGAVMFADPVDRAGIAAAMRRASLFVHPSPRETFGVVAVEALASGLPVVATDSGGVSEILGADPASLGGLVPVDDPEALGAAIVDALERRETFEPAVLRAAVERRFRADFVAEKLLVAYRQALAGSATAGLAGPIGAPTRPPAETDIVVPPARTVVVALDRERAATRLAPLPDAVRRRLDLVTAADPADVALPSLGGVVEVAIDTTWRPKPAVGGGRGPAGRLQRLARDPVGTLRRRLGLDAGSDRSLAPATDAIRAHLRAIADGAPVELLPVDGHDELAAAPLIRRGLARRSPGGLRRLADASLSEAAQESNTAAGPAASGEGEG
jgi:glycosyltransferase involved in cell wall biosynthesis